MARGFESKSVQAQWQDAEARQQEKGKRRMGHDEIEIAKKREELMLSRTRIARELAETSSDRRRQSLDAALSWLDGELTKLG